MFVNFSLKEYNTFGINARAKYFSRFTSVAELANLLSRYNGDVPKMILGGGSNILFTKDFGGLVLKNEVKGIAVVHEDNDHGYIKAGAGEAWHTFVLYCLDKNLAGAENLSLIPGNVGASPMQNIGAYGAEVKDIFHSLEAFDLEEKRVVNFTLNDCEFGYRDSIFKTRHKGRFAILNVVFRLNKKPEFNVSYGLIRQQLEKMDIQQQSIQAISQAIISIRKSKLPDPAVIGNAGSFFKNPEISAQQLQELQKAFPDIVFFPLNNGNIKLAAGWLIEQCGWKGYRRNDAGCHNRQALVLVNYGNAPGHEIYQLSEDIRKSVMQKFAVVLDTEVNIL